MPMKILTQNMKTDIVLTLPKKEEVKVLPKEIAIS